MPEGTNFPEVPAMGAEPDLFDLARKKYGLDLEPDIEPDMSDMEPDMEPEPETLRNPQAAGSPLSSRTSGAESIFWYSMANEFRCSLAGTRGGSLDPRGRLY